jgi:AcrR family transcriptional regulator
MAKPRKPGESDLEPRAKRAKPEPHADATKARKFSPTGSGTRSKLLDAAERLFAEYGYDGASLRDISNEANLHIALSTYYFGKKELLFEEVIRRRAVDLEKERLIRMRAVDLAQTSAAEAVEAIIKAYSMPILDYRFGSSKQKRSYVKLICQLFHLENWSKPLAENYSLTTKLLVDSMQTVLPKAKRDDLVNAYSNLIASLMFICSHPNRFDEFKHDPAGKAENMKTSIADFFKFNQLIFMSL